MRSDICYRLCKTYISPHTLIKPWINSDVSDIIVSIAPAGSEITNLYNMKRFNFFFNTHLPIPFNVNKLAAYKPAISNRVFAWILNTPS